MRRGKENGPVWGPSLLLVVEAAGIELDLTYWATCRL